jgi:Protein of unknown function (DUF2752)
VSYSPPPAGLPFALRQAEARLRWPDRLVLTVAGLVLLGLLATAAWLTPSERGLGTHQQLGLPPCTIVQWFGFRCPSCGMTTSWSYFVRGRVVSALRANAGGALLACVAAIGAPWLVVSGILGRWLFAPPSEWCLFGTAMVAVIVTVVQWAVRISWGW